MHRVAYPEALSVSSEEILRFLDVADKRRLYLHTLTILRHGQVACSLEWSPCRTDEPHMVFSLGKTLVAIAVAFAVSEGLMRYSDPLLLYLGDLAPAEPSERLRKVSLHHLLSMSAGFSPRVDELVLHPTDDTVRRMLALPLEAEPGERFVYCTAGIHMLCIALQRVTGMSLNDYLTPRLFAPLGIHMPYCSASATGVAYGAWGYRVSADDMAKLGQLFLQNGVWNGERVLPDFFVKTATTKQIDNAAGHPESGWEQGFGYTFWRGPEGSYRCCGVGGQLLVVLPQRDAVIVVTACHTDLFALYDLIEERIFPALLPDDDMPPTTYSDRLAKRVKRLTLRSLRGNDDSVTVRPGLYRADDGKAMCVARQGALICLGFWDGPKALPYCLLYGPEKKPVTAYYAPYFVDDQPLSYRAVWSARAGVLVCDMQVPQAPFRRRDELTFGDDGLTVRTEGIGTPSGSTRYARIE